MTEAVSGDRYRRREGGILKALGAWGINVDICLDISRQEYLERCIR